MLGQCPLVVLQNADAVHPPGDLVDQLRIDLGGATRGEHHLVVFDLWAGGQEHDASCGVYVGDGEPEHAFVEVPHDVEVVDVQTGVPQLENCHSCCPSCGDC